MAKMLVNVPAAMGLDALGRLPLMTAGLLALCVSYVGMSATSNFMQLAAARIGIGESLRPL
jgi:hypothetical protein